MATGSTGFQPRTAPAERRAFFEQQRRIGSDAESTAVLIAAMQAQIDALDARVTALETP